MDGTNVNEAFITLATNMMHAWGPDATHTGEGATGTVDTPKSQAAPQARRCF